MSLIIFSQRLSRTSYPYQYTWQQAIGSTKRFSSGSSEWNRLADLISIQLQSPPKYFIHQSQRFSRPRTANIQRLECFRWPNIYGHYASGRIRYRRWQGPQVAFNQPIYA
jgi:hypothetical protein